METTGLVLIYPHDYIIKLCPFIHVPNTYIIIIYITYVYIVNSYGENSSQSLIHPFTTLALYNCAVSLTNSASRHLVILYPSAYMYKADSTSIFHSHYTKQPYILADRYCGENMYYVYLPLQFSESDIIDASQPTIYEIII